ncbi:FkbM family methyltransferase [Candidatus Dojkabacteria bacterium]|uniref:FkbM family methyltransferase n=1 Tax=Candidatus Dojkabacteria bacterium TaxID=2099670 RepID=A0A955RLZ1_9BACT|nr:FkbM family methyltransferase [Candidatus Dojkabacteria bacterium]
MNDYNLEDLKKIKINDLDFFITERFLDHYKNGSYEKFSLQLVDWLLPEAGTFVDIGTHYGIYSLTAAKKLKKGNVISFEPVKENIEVYNNSIKENNFGNIQVINKAVSNQVGKVTFNIANASDSSGIHKHPNTETIEQREIDVTTIDSEIGDRKDIELIKIDTEGNELNVLKGMQSTLKNNPNVKLLVEFNPKVLKVAETDPLKFLEYLYKELNFDIFFINDVNHKLYKMSEKISEFSKYMDISSYINILCVPKGSFKFISILSHSPVTSGGSEKSLLDTIDWLMDKREYFIHLVIPEDGSLVNSAYNRPISYSIIDLPWWIKQNSPENIGESVGNLAYDLTKASPDLIYTNTSVIPQGGYVSRLLNLPHVWHLREFGEIDHDLSFHLNVEERAEFFEDNSNVIITNSKAVKEYFNLSDKAQIIYNFVEINTESIVKVDTFNSENLKLSFVGKIKESKGQFDAVKALSKLVKDGLKIQLVIVGDGEESYINQINEYIKKENIEENVQLVGFHQDFANFVAESDILLVCSKNEAFGRVTLEGMSLEKPVIGAGSGGTAELITDNKTGMLYKVGDIDDLASKIKKYYENRELIDKHGKAAKEKYQEIFTKENYVKQIKQAFTNALNSDNGELSYEKKIFAGFGKFLKDHFSKQFDLEAKLLTKTNQLNDIYAEYIEFQGFKKGRIWKLIQAIRKIKN